MANRPLQVGITGGIGAGKSVVSKVFSLLGVPVYDADSRAKFLMAEDANLKIQISSLLGSEAYSNQTINRVWIAQKVFSDKNLLAALNGLVHPAVAKDYEEWVKNHEICAVVLKEAALLFESGSAQLLDRVIVVSAPIDLRISRVLKRDLHRTEADIRAIIKNQMPEELSLAKADLVIHNDEQTGIINQVLKIHQSLLDLRMSEGSLI
jgi:dephospho-CoA kinase